MEKILFLSTDPIYHHRKNDHRMFRMVTSEVIDSGTCRQVDIQKTFCVSESSVIRSFNKLRSSDAEAFFVQRRGLRGEKVFIPRVLEQSQRLLDQGCSRKEAVHELGIKYDTLYKAINILK